MTFFFCERYLSWHIRGVGVLRLKLESANPPYDFAGSLNTTEIKECFMKVIEHLEAQAANPKEKE